LPETQIYRLTTVFAEETNDERNAYRSHHKTFFHETRSKGLIEASKTKLADFEA